MIPIGTLIDTEQSAAVSINQVRRAKEAGYPSAWATQTFGADALTLLSAVAAQVDGISLGTCVVPVYARNPQVMAQQALTVQSVAGSNRLSLGIGLSHQIVVETLWGYSYDRPARYMTEYLDALLPMLAGEASAAAGEVVTSITPAALSISDAPAPSLLIAALGPAMLRLAGERADGTVTWMTGIGTIASHVAPKLNEAAAEAGRPAPRIVVSLPVCITDDPAGTATKIDEQFAIYPNLPSYKAMLDIEGAARPSDIALLGSREEVIDGIGRLGEAGASEFIASISGSPEERRMTFDTLGALSSS